MSSLVNTDSTSPPLSLQAFQRSSSQASSPAGESLSPWARVAPSSMCTARWEAGKEVERRPGADVDAVQPVGVLVAELAGDDPADVAAPRGVHLVSQRL